MSRLPFFTVGHSTRTPEDFLALLAAGELVIHLLHHGKREPAQLSEGARVQPDGRILYPPRADQLAMRFD